MSATAFGVSRVWIGEISDPPQYLSLLAQRIANLGGFYRSKYSMHFETVRQEQRHINFYAKHQQKESENKKELSMISNTSKNAKNMNTRIVPKNNLSILEHSKYSESVFVMFDNHIISASNLLTTQFLDPFKLKKRTKAIFVNGECYKWGDFIIYFGQISQHTSPSDFVVVEIEFECLQSLKNGNSNKILHEIFHFLMTPIPKIIASQNQKNKNDELTKDVFVELSNEKGEKIKWKSQQSIDFSQLDISPRCKFDGRHLSALYTRAFSQITD